MCVNVSPSFYSTWDDGPGLCIVVKHLHTKYESNYIFTIGFTSASKMNYSQDSLTNFFMLLMND